jgi:hypothetical protein
MTERPNKEEIEFLDCAYNYFLDIYEEIHTKDFWEKDGYYRFNRIRDAFLIYSEILEYEPIGWFLEALKKSRPPMEAELSREYLLFIRNLLIHFPFFKNWDEISFNKGLVNWSKPGRTIDKFMTRFTGHEEVKYRMHNPKSGLTFDISINFPNKYDENTQIFLRDFMPEKEGIQFSMALMYQVLISQVESLERIPRS